MKYPTFALTIILFITQISCYATAGNPVAVSFEADNWEIDAKNSKIETYLGKPSLLIEEGKAFLKDVKFRDGMIEYDVAFSKGRGFIGASWRIQDKKNYEEFYLRSHQSGNPDANQYTPVFNGLAGWQLYYGTDFSAPVKYDFDQWIHIKIVFMGEIMKTYIQDMEKPAVTALLKHPARSSGGIGLYTGLAKAHFANFRYQDLSDSNNNIIPPTAAEKTSVINWQVSKSFDEKSLADVVRLTGQHKADLAWKKLKTDRNINPESKVNIANLAQIQGIKKGANTVFAKFIVTSEYDQTKALKFGFSDRVKLYLNDRLLYGGDNTYRTRDYRYLGTIGLFNTVYLPLKKGHNEVWMAVSESFGGWGAMAEFVNADGITIN